jgi:hypothetical protein
MLKLGLCQSSEERCLACVLPTPGVDVSAVLVAETGKADRTLRLESGNVFYYYYYYSFGCPCTELTTPSAIRVATSDSTVKTMLSAEKNVVRA